MQQILTKLYIKGKVDTYKRVSYQSIFQLEF